VKHADSILEYFEYFCQMSSKSIKFLSYTISKFARFFSDTQCTFKLYLKSVGPKCQLRLLNIIKEKMSSDTLLEKIRRDHTDNNADY